MQILSYDIEFLTKSGAYSPTTTSECDGVNDSTVIATQTCSMSLATLTGAPFNLVQGDQVLVKVRAFNSLYSSDYSNPSASATYIVAKPQKPSSPPIRNHDLSTKTSIRIDVPTVSGTNTGGLQITSYKIEWNSGGSS